MNLAQKEKTNKEVVPQLADIDMRSAFLACWDDAKESPKYDKRKWNRLRDKLHEHGVYV